MHKPGRKSDSILGLVTQIHRAPGQHWPIEAMERGIYQRTMSTTAKKRFIGIDIGGTQIKVADFLSDGTMAGQWVCETNDRPFSGGIPSFAETVRRMLDEISAANEIVGIAAPGVAAKDGRSISFQPGKMHGIEGFDWTGFLKRKTVVPILNDAHAALLGEVWKGAAVGSRDAILLTLGTGVGGAIMSDGRLLKGAIGRAGHLGHVSMEADGERSIFGTPGALETAIGNYNVTRRSGGRFSTTRELVAAYLTGDAAASEVWLKSLRTLARAITSFVNCLDPEVVILGGGIAQAGPALFDPLGCFLDDMEWRPGGHRVRVVPAALGEWAGACGAAWNARRGVESVQHHKS
jgi:glucokinase